MVKSRRSSRRVSKRANRSTGIFQRFLGNPVATAINAVGNTAFAVTDTTGKVVKTGLGGLSNVSRKVTKGANNIVRGVVKGKSRKNRKASRKNRKSRRSNRK
jgi:hypothetical protein